MSFTAYNPTGLTNINLTQNLFTHSVPLYPVFTTDPLPNRLLTRLPSSLAALNEKRNESIKAAVQHRIPIYRTNIAKAADIPHTNQTENSTQSSTVHSVTTTATPQPYIESETSLVNYDSLLTSHILIIILVIWNIYGFLIQIKLLFFTEIKELSDQVYDNCDKETSFYKYMVRLKYSDLTGGYQLSNGTIMIDLLDTRDQFITRLTIPPNWMANKLSNRKLKNNNFHAVKFRLNRKYEFPEIGCIK